MAMLLCLYSRGHSVKQPITELEQGRCLTNKKIRRQGLTVWQHNSIVGNHVGHVYKEQTWRSVNVNASKTTDWNPIADEWFEFVWVTFPFQNVYLLPLSWQVNIDYRTREKTKQSLEDPSPTSLNEVQAKVYSLMEKDSYPRFLRSKMYQDMVNRVHAQGQRRSVWLNLMKVTEDIKLDLHCKSFINPLTSTLNTVNL